MPQRKPRSIKEDMKQYLPNAEKIFGSPRLADEVQLLAIQWTLAVEDNWSLYPIIANTTHGPLRAYQTVGSQTFVSVVVYFTVSPDDETVWLHDITT